MREASAVVASSRLRPFSARTTSLECDSTSRGRIFRMTSILEDRSAGIAISAAGSSFLEVASSSRDTFVRFRHPSKLGSERKTPTQPSTDRTGWLTMKLMKRARPLRRCSRKAWSGPTRLGGRLGRSRNGWLWWKNEWTPERGKDNQCSHIVWSGNPTATRNLSTFDSQVHQDVSMTLAARQSPSSTRTRVTGIRSTSSASIF